MTTFVPKDFEVPGPKAAPSSARPGMSGQNRVTGSFSRNSPRGVVSPELVGR